MTIILDAMGSDKYPDPEIQGALDAAEMYNEKIILVGQSELIEARLKALNTKCLPVTLVHAPEVLEMGDKAVASAKAKPHNSMAVGMELVKSGQGQAFVTAGNTGAALFRDPQARQERHVPPAALGAHGSCRLGSGIL